MITGVWVLQENEVLMNALESKILRFIDESPSKVNFRSLTKRFCCSTDLRVQDLKRAVSGLIAAGTLGYTFHYGRSFIERSLDKPMRVSSHVVLKPPRCDGNGFENSVVVSIERGASFGFGDHPTTRMAIQLIDFYLHRFSWWRKKKGLNAIDLGTGSGILAIAAAKLRIGSVIGIDTDPCAIYEARRNVEINRLSNRIFILTGSLDQIKDTFDFVFANIRTPTLIAICDDLEKKASDKCVLIFSGMRTEESSIVAEPYRKIGFHMVEHLQENGWTALCLIRGLK